MDQQHPQQHFRRFHFSAPPQCSQLLSLRLPAFRQQPDKILKVLPYTESLARFSRFVFQHASSYYHHSPAKGNPYLSAYGFQPQVSVRGTARPEGTAERDLALTRGRTRIGSGVKTPGSVH